MTKNIISGVGLVRRFRIASALPCHEVCTPYAPFCAIHHSTLANAITF